MFPRLGIQPGPLEAGAEGPGGPGRRAASPRQRYRLPAGEGVAAAAQAQTGRAFTGPLWKFRLRRASRWCCGRSWGNGFQRTGLRQCLAGVARAVLGGVGPACPQVLIVVSQESWGEPGGRWKEASGLGRGGSRRWRRARFLPVFQVVEGLSEEVAGSPGEDLGQVWVLSQKVVWVGRDCRDCARTCYERGLSLRQMLDIGQFCS